MNRVPVFRPRNLKPFQLALFVILIIAFKVFDATKAPPPSSPGAERILQAYADEESGVMVEAGGRIAKVLPDDTQGDRHQRLIVELDDDHSVLVAHNIDIAPRVPAVEGDDISFRGQYEWSDQGGTVHWTHRDPQRRHEDGWIRIDGETFE